VATEDIKGQLDFEYLVKIGDTCRAFWTNAGYYHEADVRVSKVNERSFGVEIVAMTPDGQAATRGYRVGQRLVIPNFWLKGKWSWNNRLAPLKEAA